MKILKLNYNIIAHKNTVIIQIKDIHFYFSS